MNQVAKDSQLLDIAEDCFHFVTKFFEPIDISATHIYHSALELCPSSSIVRKLYYDRYHGIARFPRVVIGNQDSWDQTTSFSSKDNYNHCTWSPCGRFIAAQTKTIVEIHNQLTFQLLAVLQFPKKPSILTGPLEYSPDGRSLACVFSGGIVIWDIQTGGVARSIDCPSDIFRLVWSLDGKTIAARHVYVGDSARIKTYDVASSTRVFEDTLEKEQIFNLWAYKKSFRFMSIQYLGSDKSSASISEIGPACIKIEQLSVVFSRPASIAFSPSTSRVSISNPYSIRILDARNSQSWLQETGKHPFHDFSPDASLFAAAHKDGFRVWKYTAGSYTLLGEFPLLHIPSFSATDLRFMFSPTSLTSILSRYGNVLQVWRLHGPPPTLQACRQHGAISRSGRYIAIAHESQSTVTIIDLLSQVPSQFIDTGAKIDGLAITGNVLLVAISETVVGWLLTDDGRVGDLVEHRRAGHNDSIWTITSPLELPRSLAFTVSGQVGVIGADGIIPSIYDIGTGGVPNHVHQPQKLGLPWVSLYQPSDYKEYHYLRHHDTPRQYAPPEDSWLVSSTTRGKAGWVVDLEGRHRFWVPVEWRAPWDRKNCHHDISTLFTKLGDRSVIIEF